MSSKARFYLADVAQANPKTGKVDVTPNVLHFALSKPHYADPEKIDTLYDNIARPEHVEAYEAAYAVFKQEHPKFVLPWPTAPVSEAEPVSATVEVVEPVAEIPVLSEPEHEAPRHSKSRHGK